MPLRLTLLGVALVSCGCSVQPRQPQRPAPVLGSDIPQCIEHMQSRVAPIYPIEAMRKDTTGWAVIAYDLDGSGKATNIRKVDAEPGDTFVGSAAGAIAATQFKTGLVQSDCVAIYTYELEILP